MKKIYTTLLFGLLSITAFAQSGTFDWEDATGDNTATITQTVDGVTTTFMADGGTNLRIINPGGFGGTMGNVILNDPNIGRVTSVIFTFSEPISIESIYAFDNDSTDNDPVWTFTPTGGNNTAVVQEMPDFPQAQTGILVPLNWENVTTITVTNSSGDTNYLFDDIIFSPAVDPLSCETFESFDTPGDIDPGASQTADCENAPNFYGVALPFLGEVGTDIFIDQVMIDISHSYSFDLTIMLEDQDGNSIVLASSLLQAKGQDAFIDTIFKDGGEDITTASVPYSAGPYAAQGGNLNDTFDGVFIDDDTVWNLIVCDNEDEDTGMVNEFTITFCNRETLGTPTNGISQKITLYPNPSNDVIYLEGLLEQTSYTIFNMVGQKIQSSTVSNNEQISIQDFTNGMYFLQIENGHTIKFIKN